MGYVLEVHTKPSCADHKSITETPEALWLQFKLKLASNDNLHIHVAVLLLLLGPEPATQHWRQLPGTANIYSTLLNTGQNIKQRLVSAFIKLVAMSRAVCDALMSVWSTNPIFFLNGERMNSMVVTAK